MDYGLFFTLIVFFMALVFSSGRANIQTDAIDYYAMVQRLIRDRGNPIVPNLHFVEQRSPGYPMLVLIAYGFISLLVEPFVQTENVEISGWMPNPATPLPTESVLLPPQPLFFRDVFF